MPQPRCGITLGGRLGRRHRSEGDLRDGYCREPAPRPELTVQRGRGPALRVEPYPSPGDRSIGSITLDFRLFPGYCLRRTPRILDQKGGEARMEDRMSIRPGGRRPSEGRFGRVSSDLLARSTSPGQRQTEFGVGVPRIGRERGNNALAMGLLPVRFEPGLPPEGRSRWARRFRPPSGPVAPTARPSRENPRRISRGCDASRARLEICGFVAGPVFWIQEDGRRASPGSTQEVRAERPSQAEALPPRGENVPLLFGLGPGRHTTSDCQSESAHPLGPGAGLAPRTARRTWGFDAYSSTHGGDEEPMAVKWPHRRPGRILGANRK